MQPRLVECINKAWAMSHLLDVTTKKTICGLTWKKKAKGQVWVPEALFFAAPKRCKKCFSKLTTP